MGFKGNDIDDFDLDELMKETQAKAQEARPKKEDREKKVKQTIHTLIIAGVSIVALIIVMAIIAAVAGKSKGKDKDQITVTTQSQEENQLKEEAYEEITDVVKLYLDAKLEGNVEALAQYVDNMDGITAEDLAAESAYIDEYSSITCYTKNGLYENTYVVYVYYELQLKNIKTSVPGITTLYVIRDDETGNIFIHNGVTDGEVLQYIKELTKQEDVAALFDDVNKMFNEAVESDEELKSFYEALQKKSAE